MVINKSNYAFKRDEAKVHWPLVLILFFIIVFLVPFLTGCIVDGCVNEPLQTIVSPSGAFKAVVFSRDCGATTGFNTQVSVLGANETLPDEGGNIFISNKPLPIAVRWSSDSALQISGVGNVSPIKQNPHISTVTVTFVK